MRHRAGALVIVLLSIFALLAVTGCAKDPGMSSSGTGPSGSQTGGSSGGSSSAPKDIGPLKVGDTADFNGLTFVFKEFKISKEGPQLIPGDEFLYVHMVAKNGTKEGLLVNSLTNLRLIDPKGESHTKSAYGDGVVGNKFDANMRAGESLDGWVGFTLKPQTGEFTLQVMPVTGGKAIYKFEVK